MAETTVKQRTFAFIMSDFQIGLPGFVYIDTILAQ